MKKEINPTACSARPCNACQDDARNASRHALVKMSFPVQTIAAHESNFHRANMSHWVASEYAARDA